MDDQAKFFEEISVLVESMNELSKSVLPDYKNFVKDVISNKITDIHEIERQLDYMLTFCFNEEILLLFKVVLRKIFRKHPDVVESYVTTYFEMYGDNADEI